MPLRNIAIIAHVDHGKTTLVDRLLAASGVFRANQKVAERALDRNDLERERGITILAKVTALEWRGTRINIVDTPGHADFGGEVERILGMVDGAVLLVDAAEGPMPQTKFVLAKALAIGLRPIVVINKIDRPDERHQQVVNDVFDLFAALDASDDQLDFPVIYGSAKEGWMAERPTGPKDGVGPLLESIVAHTPPPAIGEGPFAMLVTMIERDAYLGRILTGRVHSGTIAANAAIKALGHDGQVVEEGRVSRLMGFHGLERVTLDAAGAGDIVAIAGLDEASVSDTICDPTVAAPLSARPVDPPTLTMTFRINDGPLAGREGAKVQSRVIRERLMAEAESNVALKVADIAGEAEAFQVSGRGELQLAILIETMRREGFELTVGRPRVVLRRDGETGDVLEPVEEVVIDVDEEFSGVVVEKLSARRAALVDMRACGVGRQRLTFHAPTRGLIGYHGELLSDTRGSAVMNRLFHGWRPYAGDIEARRNGVLIANSAGDAVAYALWKLEERGRMFVAPGDKVYPGMIVGEHSRGNDLEVNVLRTKQLTNIRAAGKDEAVDLSSPVKLPLERALAYIDDDELVEVTPRSIRLRKAILDPHQRKRARRSGKAALTDM